MNRVRNVLIAIGVGVVFMVAYLIMSALIKPPQKAIDFSYHMQDGTVTSLYSQARDNGAVLIFIDPELEGSNKILESVIKKADGIPVIAVSVKDENSAYLTMLPENARTLKNLVLDGEEIEKLYNVTDRAPITYFIDNEFYVKQAFVGTIKEKTIAKYVGEIKE
jgi:hypothetical protein